MNLKDKIIKIKLGSDINWYHTHRGYINGVMCIVIQEHEGRRYVMYNMEGMEEKDGRLDDTIYGVEVESIDVAEPYKYIQVIDDKMENKDWLVIEKDQYHDVYKLEKRK